MYRVFDEEDQGKLHGFIEENSFGLLVSQLEGCAVARHPRPERRPHGTLIGHMARANSQWQGRDGVEALAVFDLLSLISAGLSNLISNVPAVLLMEPGPQGNFRRAPRDCVAGTGHVEHARGKPDGPRLGGRF